jgi:ABC-type multidrug transport system fused ATPase/permease subunit
VLPGIALAILLGFDGAVGAAIGAVVMIAGVTLITQRSRLSSDTAIGLLFVGMLSLGVVIVSRSTSFSGDLTRILFGEILGVVSIADEQVAIRQTRSSYRSTSSPSSTASWPSRLPEENQRNRYIIAAGKKAAISIGLRVEDMSLSFGHLSALVNLNINVSKREILAIIGPNGAGKTCLLNCINGFYKPQKGEIYFGGQRITRIHPDKAAGYPYPGPPDPCPSS